MIEARTRIRELRARSGRPLSFNAYVIGCFARSVAADPRVAAIRHGHRRLLVFRDVDVALAVESEVEEEAIPVPHIVRAAQRRSFEDISAPVSAGAAGPVPYTTPRRLLGLWLLLPAWFRRRLPALVLSDARRRKRLTGTVLVTAVSLPGKGRAWGLPNGTNYPVSLVIGGLRLGDDGRETVALTLTFDHDTVNGAPAARFVRRFARSLESAEGLPEGQLGPADDHHRRPTTTTAGRRPPPPADCYLRVPNRPRNRPMGVPRRSLGPQAETSEERDCLTEGMKAIRRSIGPPRGTKCRARTPATPPDANAHARDPV